MPSTENIPPNVKVVNGEDSLLYKAVAGTAKGAAKIGAASIYGIGAAAIWTGKNIGLPVVAGTTKFLGSTALKTADMFAASLFMPGQTMTAAEAYAQGGAKGAAINFLNGFRNPAAGLSQTAKKLYEKFPLVEKTKTEQVFNKKAQKFETRGGNLRITGTGYGLLGGAALISSAFQAYDNYIVRHMGAVDSNKVTATPDYNPQEYHVQSPDFAGATGDLVFALHANRQG